MLHDPKTVIGSDFDQETAEKIAPQFIPRLELANCMKSLIVSSVCRVWNRIAGVVELSAVENVYLCILYL